MVKKYTNITIFGVIEVGNLPLEQGYHSCLEIPAKKSCQKK